MTQSKYMADMITEKLAGATITGGAEASPSFGMCVTLKGGKKVSVWVDCDAEGNGPGWLSIEDYKEAAA